jgi:hypothetical protein
MAQRTHTGKCNMADKQAKSGITLSFQQKHTKPLTESNIPFR